MEQSRWVVVGLLCIAILVVSCRSSSDFLGATVPPDQSPSRNETVPSSLSPESGGDGESADSPSSDQSKEMENIDEVTEVATYDVKDSCKKDSAGVVRVFDEGGRKSVYRPFCDGKGLVSFSCENNKARASTSNCPNGCMLDESRNAVCRSTSIPPRNPDPRRTSGATLDRTLGTGN